MKPPEDPRKAWARRFYSTKEWLDTRDAVLEDEPMCRRCEHRVASVVHHIVELLTAPRLALVRSNLEPLCKWCHAEHHKSRKPWKRYG